MQKTTPLPKPLHMKPLLIFVFVAWAFGSLAQTQSTARFGKITPADFHRTYSIDSNANTVIIADIGSTRIVGNSKSAFSLEFKHYRRAQIYSINGYDLADVSIDLYTDGELEEEVRSLHAVTYNLEKGKIVQTKLDIKTGLFKDRLNKSLYVQKFTFPNVKPGSIIEFEYTKTSDFLRNLEPWEFQGDEPRVFSEYNLSIPSFYTYVFLTQGYRQFDIKDKKESKQSFKVIDTRGSGSSSNYDFTDNVTNYRWVMKDVPALKLENYTSTLSNHISKIEFQLTEQSDPLPNVQYLETWEKLADDLLKAEYFGEALAKENPWLNDYLKPLVKETNTNLAKARNIYTYVQENFTCINYNGITMDQTLRNVARSRKGNVAEINLLLIAMLRHAGIPCDPVLLSTRTHGYTYPDYPLPDRFNYVVCKMNDGKKDYFLDASKPFLGFGKLGYDCYNGHARVINAAASPVELIADSQIENKNTSVFIINDEKGGLMGSIQQSPGYFESYAMRNLVKNNGKDQLLEMIRHSLNPDIQASEPAIDSLNDYDNPLFIRYNFELKTDKAPMFYFNPMMGEGWKENPFQSRQRFYPVEMPYAIDEVYSLRLDVPAGYAVDELPKQAVIKLNEQDDGIFEYRLSEINGIISLRSRLRINRTFFQPDEYDMLREFFNLVVKKHAEQIVFKRKKDS